MAKKSDNFPVPDPKYLKGRAVPNYPLDKDLVEWIKRWKAAGYPSAELVNHLLRQVRDILGEPPAPKAMPNLPDGATIRPPRKRKKQ